MKIIINNMEIKVEVHRKFTKRLVGFMFKKDKINYAICFPNCNSIHTFFMFQNIDVVMTDKNNKIIKIYRNLKPNKIILPQKHVHYTYELPEGSTNFLKLNETITLYN